MNHCRLSSWRRKTATIQLQNYATRKRCPISRKCSGQVIAVAIEGDQEIAQLVTHVVYIPHAPELLLPILEVIPLQLLAYHIAVRRGCDVDQPRNLAKSVTVE